MRLAEKAYRSPLGRIMSTIGHFLARVQRPFMVYGYCDPISGIFRKWTRMSSTVTIMNKKRLSVGDHVWVWHHSILDATEGLVIEQGVQIGAWVGIFTHGSESAIRILGEHFVHVPNSKRYGYTRGSVKIGAFTFIGAGSIILPSVTIGSGCIVGACSLVTRDVPDFSIITGAPAKIKGSTKDLDMKLFKIQDCSNTYYNADILGEIKRKLLT